MREGSEGAGTVREGSEGTGTVREGSEAGIGNELVYLQCLFSGALLLRLDLPLPWEQRP